MTTPNVPLQKRAGRNIGIEPGAHAFLQDAGGRETEIARPIGSYTTILECPQGVARNPNVDGAQARAGVICNKGADFFYEVRFRDTLGNEVLLASGSVLAGAVGVDFEYGTSNYPLVLTPSEKIVIKSVASLP
jgi:hypothetical protein